jgi:tRNA(His) 5'-end guanylyltransferase
MQETGGDANESAEVFGEHLFGERVSKLASVSAGVASVSFYRHIKCVLDDFVQAGGDEDAADSVIPHFDCRAFAVPSDNEALDAVRWRCAYDCIKNSQQRFAQMTLASSGNNHSEILHKVSAAGAVEIAEEKIGQRCADVDEGVKYGFLVKKATIFKEVVDRKTLKTAFAEQTGIVAKVMLAAFRDENSESQEEARELLMAKRWPIT